MLGWNLCFLNGHPWLYCGIPTNKPHTQIHWCPMVRHDSFTCNVTPWGIIWLMDSTLCARALMAGIIWHDTFIWDMPPEHWTCLIEVSQDAIVCDMTYRFLTFYASVHGFDDIYISYDMAHSFSTQLLPLWHASGSLGFDMTQSYETLLLNFRRDSLIWGIIL